MGLVDSIKKEAQDNRTKIQSSDATQLEKILNATLYLDKNVEEETKFVKMVMTRGYENQERVGLHASSFIVGEKEFCLRAQVLSLMYKQLQGEQIPVGLKKIFEEGNAIHEKWQRLLIRAGYASANTLDVTQFNKQFRISFTPDIICKIPEFYDGKMVGEIKSVNTFQFQRMVKHPSASKQLQWYMHLTGIHKGFVLCEDKNTQDTKLEVYDYDSMAVATFIERAEAIKYHYKRVHSEGKMVKRPSDAKSSDCKRCSKCVMRDACWNIGMGKVPIK
ncbi:MAG: hypothetical protein PHN69_05300 [Candidatus Pacebacteria bacterium]|nr:hypothetical protein [Candidatus Paceibacterota bacterium]